MLILSASGSAPFGGDGAGSWDRRQDDVLSALIDTLDVEGIGVRME